MSSASYPFARQRISELIDSAHTAVGQIHSEPHDADSMDFFKATWTTSRAAGFLEAFAIVDPAMAGDMLADFEAVAGLVDQLRASRQTVGGWTSVGGQANSVMGAAADADRRAAPGPGSSGRRVTVRRTISERRTTTRRQLKDRRGS